MAIDKAAYDASADAVAAVLEVIAKTAEDMREIWPEVVPNVFQSIDKSFESEGRPGWIPLSPRSERERAAQGYGAAHPILQRTGELRREATGQGHRVTWLSKPNELRFIADSSFEKFRNHFGFSIFNRIEVPARAFFHIQDDDAEPIVRTIALAFAKRIQIAVKG